MYILDKSSLERATEAFLSNFEQQNEQWFKKLGRVAGQIHFMRHELARVSLQETSCFSASPEIDSLISKQLMHESTF